MSFCNDRNNSGNAGAVQSAEMVNEINLSEKIEAPNTVPYPIAFGKSAARLNLTKGSYQIKGEIEANNAEPITIFDRELIVTGSDGTPKRIYIHRLHIAPAEIVINDEERGEISGAKFNMSFTVIDNPIPIAGIVYGLGAIGTLVSGYFFVDRVDKFTSSTTGGLITLALAGVSAYIAFKNYK